VGVLVVSGAMLATSLLGVRGNRTPLGVGLGADYAAFYVAGQIVNDYGAARLYDTDLQATLYHRLLPGEARDVVLPYAYAPFLAGPLAGLARLPYAWSYAAWLAVSVGLYLGGLACLLRAAGALGAEARRTALLLALAFEPFAIECIHGGQISTIGFFLISLAILLARRGRSVLAGVALAGCLYKPTLLPLLVPAMVLLGQWRALAGFALGAGALAAISLAAPGPEACLAYGRLLAGYAHLAADGGPSFQTWKFVDLNAFLKMLVGGPGAARLAPVAVLGCAALWQVRRRFRGGDAGFAWAAVVASTLVLNLYVGVYDVILVVPALLLAADGAAGAGRALPRWFVLLVGAVWAAPWVTQHLARATGFGAYTLVLLGVAVTLLTLPDFLRRSAGRRI